MFSQHRSGRLRWTLLPKLYIAETVRSLLHPQPGHRRPVHDQLDDHQPSDLSHASAFRFAAGHVQGTYQGLLQLLHQVVPIASLEGRLTALQPQQKLAHVIIVQGTIAENQPIGSLVIHFSAPGHGEIGLNSNQILASVHLSPVNLE